MKLKNAITAALEGNAILFAGSGFSYGATNWNGDKLPCGNGLRDIIAADCGISKTSSPLSSVADYYLSLEDNSEESLIQLLYSTFVLGTTSEAHKTIMGIRWKRIYTTNYDQVIETAAKDNHQLLKTVTITDPVEINTGERVCVHLNGSITNLTKDNLQDTFKLTDRSYDYDTIVGKPWYEFLERDFASAKAIIIVGFSMQNDIDIRRVIARREVANRVVFVIGNESDPISINTLKKYADVETVGVDGLAERIETAKKKYVPSPMSCFEFTSFTHEYMCPQIKCKTELSDLTSFYFLGRPSPAIYQKDSTGNYPNLLLRDAVHCFLRERLNCKVFLGVSSIGNGKTVLCELIRNELREKDVHVFTLNRRTVDIDAEVEHICQDYNGKQKVIIIDDYYKYLDVLEVFGCYRNVDKITFLLTTRTSKIAANYRRLIRALQIQEKDVRPLYLNTLSEEEEKSFADALIHNKMLDGMLDERHSKVIDFIREECKSSIGNVVVRLFDSSYIKNELNKLYKKAVEDDTEAMKEITVATLVSEVMNLRLSLDEITLLLGIDYIKLRLSESELINEIFESQQDGIKVKSPIIARKIVQEIIPIDTALSVITKLIVGADKRHNRDRFYTETMKAIISHTNFTYWIQQGDSIGSIKKFYDNLRNVEFFSDRNPFYWEQYASICIDAKDYLTAKQCLNTAFSEAKKIEAFVPFQVETVYARMLISSLKDQVSAGSLSGDSIRNMLCDASKRLFMYYSHPEDDHYYVFQLYNSCVSIFIGNIGLFCSRDISIWLEDMVKVNRLLIQYQAIDESKYFPSTRKWLNNLSEAIELAKKQLKGERIQAEANKNSHGKREKALIRG